MRCIFCLKELPVYNMGESDLGMCCDAFDKDVPLAWASRKSRKYWIYVDFINFSACNSMFCSYIELDSVSKSVEQTKQEEFINLEDCIRLHNQQETVEMECDKCKHNEQTLEHLIGGMPNILVVHMKEFRYTPEGHLIKLDLRLKWQEFLDSSKFTLTVQGKIYELFALVRHSGNSHSGHYTCMAKRKHPFENKKVWVNFDDETTEILEQLQKVIDDAYLLFYKKVDMPTSALVIYSDLGES
jgi:ubiquitin C-terminal hydrolase